MGTAIRTHVVTMTDARTVVAHLVSEEAVAAGCYEVLRRSVWRPRVAWQPRGGHRPVLPVLPGGGIPVSLANEWLQDRSAMPSWAAPGCGRLVMRLKARTW